MHPKLVAAYGGLKRYGKQPDKLRKIEMCKMHICYPVNEAVTAIQHMQLANPQLMSDFVIPVTSRSPASLLSLVVDGVGWPSAYIVERDQVTDFHSVTSIQDFGDKTGRWSAVECGGWVPGRKAASINISHPDKMQDYALKSVDRQFLADTIAKIALLIAFMQTPRALVSAPMRGNIIERERQKRVTGKAATAWTNVTINLGARTDTHHDEETSREAGVALHLRRGHWAWSRTQRETPKGQWLDESHGARSWRGPGWYVFKKETEVGNPDRAGVKAQRHMPKLPGSKVAAFSVNLGDDLAPERAALLSAHQRNLLTRAGYVGSNTLH